MRIAFDRPWGRSTIYRWAGFALLYWAIPIAIFFPYALTASGSFFDFGDSVEQSYPWMVMIARSLHEGVLPLWNPFSQGGTSFVGEIQSGVFYPVTLLFAWTFGSREGIPPLALEYWVIIHFTIALCGFHWFARELGVSRTASFVSALVYALLGPVLIRAGSQVGIFFGLVWIPVALAFAWRFFAGRSYWNIFFAGIVVATQVNAGHIQPAFHTLVLIGSLAVLGVYRSNQRWLTAKRVALGAAVGCLGLLIFGWPQLMLGVEYLSNVYRWISPNDVVIGWQRVPLRVFLTHYTLTPLTALSIFNPWQFSADDSNTLFIGIPLLVLLVAGLGWGQRHLERDVTFRRLRVWILGLGMAGLLLAMGIYTLLPLLLYPLPLATAVRSLGRYVILFHFMAAVAIAFIIDQIVKAGLLREWLRRMPAWIIWALFFHGLAWAYYRHSILPRGLGLQVALLAGGMLAIRWRQQVAIPIIIAIVVASVLLVRDYPQHPLGGERIPVADRFPAGRLVKRILLDEPPMRAIIDDSARLPKNYGIVTGIHTKEGHSATYYRPYFDFLAQDWALRSKVNDILGVGWVISRKSLDLQMELNDPDSGLKLYRRPGAWPRAWLEGDTAKLLGGVGIVPTIQVNQYAAHRIVITTETSKADRVVISDIAYPGWVATVNGREVAIGQFSPPGSGPLFRAVDIPGGTSVVILEYRPFARLPFPIPRWMGG